MTVGVVAAGLIGFGMGAEADVTPYILSRYLGSAHLPCYADLTWTAYDCRRRRPSSHGPRFRCDGIMRRC